MPASMPPFEVFRAGTHVDMGGRELTFSAADIAAMAAAFKPERRAAPLVVGHPKHDAPAYGWVDRLEARDGSLWAHPVDAEPAFAELVRTKRFPNRSVMLLPPGAAGNPVPDAYYLKHVGFLGAQPPAVQGLKPIAFSADEEAVQIGFMEAGTAWRFSSIGRLFRALRERLIAEKDVETADRVLPTYAIEDLEAAGREAAASEPLPAYSEPSKEPTVTDTTAERAAALDARERDLQAREQQLQTQALGFAERDARDRAAEDTALVDRLVAEGRLIPALKPDTLAFMAQLQVGEATIAFAEGGAKHTPRAAFHALLGRMPKVVPLGEIAGGEGVTRVDPNDAEGIKREALAYQERERKAGRTVTDIEAVAFVTREHVA